MKLEKVLEQLKDTSKDKPIEWIDLGGAGIGDDGARALAKGLMENGTVIKHLSLDNNWIGDEGAKALAETIINRSTIINQFCISLNQIGPDGEKK